MEKKSWRRVDRVEEREEERERETSGERQNGEKGNENEAGTVASEV